MKPMVMVERVLSSLYCRCSVSSIVSSVPPHHRHLYFSSVILRCNLRNRTDNPNRANMEIRSAVNKNHGKMAEQGSVLFLYDRKGKLEVDKILDEEQLMNAAIDAGVDDFEIADGEEEASCVVFVDPKDATAMSDAIQTLDGANSKFSLAYVSKAPVEVTDDEFEKNMKIYDALMELDDVDQVEHNMSN
jgi:transcriptional/translational regulatory protein YebC/TACO1